MENKFDFCGFARQIYADSPDIDQKPLQLNVGEKFLLPALYGGNATGNDADGTFQALVVLEAPSVRFTRENWKSPTDSFDCASAVEAVSRHRRIFFKWASSGLQAELFRILVPKFSTPDELFRRLYITDIWKDAGFRANSNSHYKEYWKQKLAFELRCVPCKRVIFVGEEARKFGWNLVPVGMRRDAVPFPNWRTTFKNRLPQIRIDLCVDSGQVCPNDQPVFREAPGAAAKPHLNIVSRR